MTVFTTTADHLHMAIGRADAKHVPQLPDQGFDSSPLQVWLHRSMLGDGKSTAEQHLADIRRIRSGLEHQLIEHWMVKAISKQFTPMDRSWILYFNLGSSTSSSSQAGSIASSKK